MKKYMLWIAVAALCVPIILRGLWFYRGIPTRPEISTPNYQAMTMQPIALKTAAAEDQNIKQMQGVVLLDAAHSNQYQQPEAQILKEAILKRGGNVELVSDLNSLANRLKYASAYIVIAPATIFTADEARIVKGFVARGGRLIIFTDATRGMVVSDYASGSLINYSDASAVNPLLGQFGITVNNNYLYNLKKNDGNFRNVYFEDFGKNELTFGLKQVTFYGSHSLKVESGTMLLQASANTLSSIDDAHHANEGGAALSGDGNVLAFGDFTFLTSPYRNAVDNSTLIANIADFALGGKRIPTLQNFPFVFTQSDVQLYHSTDVILTAEIIETISGLQSSFNSNNTVLRMVDEAPVTGDAVILGTFDSSAELKKFLEPFNITLDGGNYITLPKLGKVGRYGNGIVLLDKNAKGSRLILLADTQDDLVSLIDTLSGSTLKGCVLQDAIGICSVGSGGDYSEPTPTPVSTPTSGG